MTERGGEAGFSLSEILVVVALLGTIVLITVPNILEMQRTYRLQSSTRGVIGLLQIARMKAVANNASFVAELDSAYQGQCGAAPSNVFVAYQPVTPGFDKVVECYKLPSNVTVSALTTGSNPKKVTFRSTGMAKTDAPNWFLVKAEQGYRCQLVCVNAAGAVRMNRPIDQTTCASSPYGATGSTPCGPPV